MMLAYRHGEQDPQIKIMININQKYSLLMQIVERSQAGKRTGLNLSDCKLRLTYVSSCRNAAGHFSELPLSSQGAMKRPYCHK